MLRGTPENGSTELFRFYRTNDDSGTQSGDIHDFQSQEFANPPGVMHGDNSLVSLKDQLRPVVAVEVNVESLPAPEQKSALGGGQQNHPELGQRTSSEPGPVANDIPNRDRPPARIPE
jgi:hypothetical protein